MNFATKRLSRAQQLSLVGATIFYVVAGTLHFIKPEIFKDWSRTLGSDRPLHFFDPLPRVILDSRRMWLHL